MVKEVPLPGGRALLARLGALFVGSVHYYGTGPTATVALGSQGAGTWETGFPSPPWDALAILTGLRLAAGLHVVRVQILERGVGWRGAEARRNGESVARRHAGVDALRVAGPAPQGLDGGGSSPLPWSARVQQPNVPPNLRLRRVHPRRTTFVR